jgi:small GTP-binding protein
MLTKILTPELESLLREERRVLGRLKTALLRIDAASSPLSALDASIEQLDELFLLVVVGEFNAGKSAVINALVGSDVLAEGVTPTTAQVHVLQYGEAVTRSVREGGVHVITAPVPLLQDIHVVDTPGTNAVIREHERITSDFVPRADVVLFVTSIDRPFTETERAFLEGIRSWGKKVLVVINKIDIVESRQEVEQVRQFVAESARTLLGFTPEIFTVSARLARRAREGDPSQRAESGFEALERYLRSTLDAPARLQLKLLNPLGVGTAVASSHLLVAQERLALLKDDYLMLDEVERQLAVYQQDVTRNLDLRMSDIDRILLELERRGHDYFDETLRIGRVFDLLNRSRVQEGFEREVVADAPQQIERRIGELVDWLVEADLRQWQAVTSHLAERRREHKARIVGGDEPGRFHYDRTRLIDSVSRETQQVVDSYDRRREARALADGARNAVAAAAAAGAGALGLGAIVTAAATTAAADVTGLVLASVLAAVGFFVLPAKRRKTKLEMRQKITAVRERLSRALHGQFAQEIERSADRIRESIAPYSRFVRAEGDRFREIERELREITGALESLRERIERRAA